jgi:hypothetical protein
MRLFGGRVPPVLQHDTAFFATPAPTIEPQDAANLDVFALA